MEHPDCCVLGQADISTLEPIEELRGKTNKVLGVVPVL